MARIVGGSPMGELRGKLGSSVFSRNAAGAYVRSYVVPVNPNTASQAQARSSLAQVVGSYHSLTAEQKELWDEYALTSGVFSSGFNAFVSSNQTIRTNQNVKNDDLIHNGDETIEYEDWQYTATPPQGDMVIPYQLSIDVAELTYSLASGTYDIDLRFDVLNNTETEGPGPNPNFTPSGITIYISAGNSQPNMFLKDKNIKIAALNVIESITEGTSYSSILEYVATLDITGNKSKPNPLEYVRISAFWCDKYGRELKIGSKESLILQT